MGQPDASDLHVRVAVPFTIDDQRQYLNESHRGVWLTEYGIDYSWENVLPFLPGQPEEKPSGWQANLPGEP
jgi:hypothetical protein